MNHQCLTKNQCLDMEKTFSEPNVAWSTTKRLSTALNHLNSPLYRLTLCPTLKCLVYMMEIFQGKNSRALLFNSRLVNGVRIKG